MFPILDVAGDDISEQSYFYSERKKKAPLSAIIKLSNNQTLSCSCATALHTYITKIALMSNFVIRKNLTIFVKTEVTPVQILLLFSVIIQRTCFLRKHVWMKSYVSTICWNWDNIQKTCFILQIILVCMNLNKLSGTHLCF